MQKEFLKLQLNSDIQDLFLENESHKDYNLIDSHAFFEKVNEQSKDILSMVLHNVQDNDQVILLSENPTIGYLLIASDDYKNINNINNRVMMKQEINLKNCFQSTKGMCTYSQFVSYFYNKLLRCFLNENPDQLFNNVNSENFNKALFCDTFLQLITYYEIMVVGLVCNRDTGQNKFIVVSVGSYFDETDDKFFLGPGPYQTFLFDFKELLHSKLYFLHNLSAPTLYAESEDILIEYIKREKKNTDYFLASHNIPSNKDTGKNNTGYCHTGFARKTGKLCSDYLRILRKEKGKEKGTYEKWNYQFLEDKLTENKNIKLSSNSKSVIDIFENYIVCDYPFNYNTFTRDIYDDDGNFSYEYLNPVSFWANKDYYETGKQALFSKENTKINIDKVLKDALFPCNMSLDNLYTTGRKNRGEHINGSLTTFFKHMIGTHKAFSAFETNYFDLHENLHRKHFDEFVDALDNLINYLETFLFFGEDNEQKNASFKSEKKNTSTADFKFLNKAKFVQMFNKLVKQREDYRTFRLPEVVDQFVREITEKETNLLHPLENFNDSSSRGGNTHRSKSRKLYSKILKPLKKSKKKQNKTQEKNPLFCNKNENEQIGGTSTEAENMELIVRNENNEMIANPKYFQNTKNALTTIQNLQKIQGRTHQNRAFAIMKVLNDENREELRKKLKEDFGTDENQNTSIYQSYYVGFQFSNLMCTVFAQLAIKYSIDMQPLYYDIDKYGKPLPLEDFIMFFSNKKNKLNFTDLKKHDKVHNLNRLHMFQISFEQLVDEEEKFRLQVEEKIKSFQNINHLLEPIFKNIHDFYKLFLFDLKNAESIDDIKSHNLKTKIYTLVRLVQGEEPEIQRKPIINKPAVSRRSSSHSSISSLKNSDFPTILYNSPNLSYTSETSNSSSSSSRSNKSNKSNKSNRSNRSNESKQSKKLKRSNRSNESKQSKKLKRSNRSSSSRQTSTKPGKWINSDFFDNISLPSSSQIKEDFLNDVENGEAIILGGNNYNLRSNKSVGEKSLDGLKSEPSSFEVDKEEFGFFDDDDDDDDDDDEHFQFSVSDSEKGTKKTDDDRYEEDGFVFSGSMEDVESNEDDFQNRQKCAFLVFYLNYRYKNSFRSIVSKLMEEEQIQTSYKEGKTLYKSYRSTYIPIRHPEFNEIIVRKIITRVLKQMDNKRMNVPQFNYVSPVDMKPNNNEVLRIEYANADRIFSTEEKEYLFKHKEKVHHLLMDLQRVNKEADKSREVTRKNKLRNDGDSYERKGSTSDVDISEDINKTGNIYSMNNYSDITPYSRKNSLKVVLSNIKDRSTIRTGRKKSLVNNNNYFHWDKKNQINNDDDDDSSWSGSTENSMDESISPQSGSS